MNWQSRMVLRAALEIAGIYALGKLLRFLPIILSPIFTMPRTVADMVGTLGLVIYCMAIATWVYHVRRRVVDRKTRLCLYITAGAMVAWLLLRSIRFTLPNEHDALIRMLWYGYYGCMLAIANTCLFAALRAGKTTGYRVNTVWYATLPVSLALFLFILANDTHQTVFVFTDMAAEQYSYGPWYFVTLTWIFALVVTAFCMLVRGSTLAGKIRRILPSFIALALAVAFCIAYVLVPNGLFQQVFEFTPFLCALIIFMWESCIRTGLVRSNTRYDELFEASTIAAQALDEDGTAQFLSRYAQPISPEVFARAKTEQVPIGPDVLLKGVPVSGGWFMWQEDMTVPNSMVRELRAIQEQLQGESELIYAERSMRSRDARNREKSTLYDTIARSVSEELASLDTQLKDAIDAQDSAKTHHAFEISCVVGAYIKRKSNLIILASTEPMLQAEELSLSVKEIADSMEACGIDCSVDARLQGPIHPDVALKALEMVFHALMICYQKRAACMVELTCDQKLQVAISAESVDGQNIFSSMPRSWVKQDTCYACAQFPYQPQQETENAEGGDLS